MGIERKIAKLPWWKRWQLYALFCLFILLLPLGWILQPIFELCGWEPKPYEPQPSEPLPTDTKGQLEYVEQIMARMKEIEQEFKQAKERGWT